MTSLKAQERSLEENAMLNTFKAATSDALIQIITVSALAKTQLETYVKDAEGNLDEENQH